MRFLIFALVHFGIDIYAFQAVTDFLSRTDATLAIPVGVLFWSVPVLTLCYLIGSQYGVFRSLSGKVKIFATAILTILYFSRFITAIGVFIEDLRRGISWIANALIPGADLLTTRLSLMTDLSLAAGLIPAVLLIYGIVRNPYRYKVHDVDIPIPRLPEALEGLRIVQISDIHAGSLYDPSRVARSVEMINSLNPDLVFFTGDLVNARAEEIVPFIPIFGKIRARYGVYSVTGNHDYGDYVQWPDSTAKQENFARFQKYHKELGWDLLMNTHRSLAIRGAQVAIIGVENASANPRFRNYGDMQKAKQGLDQHDLTILLSHDPSHWDHEIVKRYPEVDLTLSGHTHGFQFGVEFRNMFKWSPVQYVYRKWSGLYHEGHQYLYINRGLGFLGYPGRVGILPEITLITLRKTAPDDPKRQ